MGFEYIHEDDNKLKRHNQYIIKEIQKTKEYNVYLKIKLFYEELMKRVEDESKKQLFTHQFCIARDIFTKRIIMHNKNWSKIKDE